MHMIKEGPDVYDEDTIMNHIYEITESYLYIVKRQEIKLWPRIKMNYWSFFGGSAQ
jgi:hypothetical protein